MLRVTSCYLTLDTQSCDASRHERPSQFRGSLFHQFRLGYRSREVPSTKATSCHVRRGHPRLRIPCWKARRVRSVRKRLNPALATACPWSLFVYRRPGKRSATLATRRVVHLPPAPCYIERLVASAVFSVGAGGPHAWCHAKPFGPSAVHDCLHNATASFSARLLQ